LSRGKKKGLDDAICGQKKGLMTSRGFAGAGKKGLLRRRLKCTLVAMSSRGNPPGGRVTGGGVASEKHLRGEKGVRRGVRRRLAILTGKFLSRR